MINSQSGFIALISAIVISFLLLAVTLGLGLSIFFGRFDILDSESKERSLALAEACVDQAMLEMSEGTFYATLTDYTSPDGTIICKRQSLSGGVNTIKTQGEFNKSFTNLKVEVDGSTFSIISWEECPTGSSC